LVLTIIVVQVNNIRRKVGKGSNALPPATFSSFDPPNKSGIMRQNPRRMGQPHKPAAA